MDMNGSEEDSSIKELKDWLFGRVADDNDIVVDDMQEEFGEHFDKLETENGVEPSEEYKKNMKLLETSIAELKTDKGRLKIKVEKDKQKITDGIRPCWYGGNRNAQGFPHGEGMLAYENKDNFQGKFNNGVLDREGRLSLTQNCGIKIVGKWQDGLMEGEMRIDTEVGGWIEGYYHRGVAHGFQREFGIRETTTDKYPLVRFVGRYFRGVRRGFCWKGLFGGGFLCGYIKDGSFTGNDMAFIYPDFKTALRGEFKDGKAVKARMCTLIGSKFEKGMCVPIFTKGQGEAYEFEEPSRKSLGKNPMVPEPWENTLVYVKASELPQGGDGLFAKQLRPKGSMLAFYNGIRLNTSSLLMEQRYGHSDYRIRLNAEVDLDIPKGYESLEKYCATLAHKANHSFQPNAEWLLFEHPRFGLIRGLRALVNIEADQEILVNYTINLADSPEWYRVLWIRHQRANKNASDQSIKRILDRYTENTGKRVEIPASEELHIPEPTGMENLEEIPDDTEIELNTPRAQILEMRRKDKEEVQELKRKEKQKEEPKVEEIF